MTIDTHTHAWGPPSEDHPWVNEAIIEYGLSESSVDLVYTAEKLLSDMDDVGIDEAVLVGYPITEWTDNWYTVDAVAEFDRLTGIGMMDPFAADAGDTLRELMAADGMLGVRLGAIFPLERPWTTFDRNAAWFVETVDEDGFWQAARETDALVQLLVHTGQLDQVREVVDTYPDVRYLIDHFAYVSAGASLDAEVQSDLAALAEVDTVGMKVSSASDVSDRPYPYEDLHEHVRWLIDNFGRDRVMWGSDFPNVSGDATYEETLTWLDTVDGLSSGDQKWITGRAFREFAGL